MTGEYRSRQYLNRVLKNSGASWSEQEVLMCLCWFAEFDRPEVTVSKSRISEMTGRHEKTVQACLRRLVARGALAVVRNGSGGRNTAPTYRLLVATKGESDVPKGESDVPKGESDVTPSIESIDSMSRRGPGRATQGHKVPSGQGARQWRGRQAEKGGADGNRRALTQEQKEKTERLGLAMKLAGEYGAAKRLIAAWDAGKIPEGQPWP